MHKLCLSTPVQPAKASIRQSFLGWLRQHSVCSGTADCVIIWTTKVCHWVTAKLFVVLVASCFAKRFSSTSAYILEWISFNHGWGDLTGYGLPFVFRYVWSFRKGLFRNLRCLWLLVLLFPLFLSPLLPVLLFWHVLPQLIFRRVVVIAQTWNLESPVQVLLLHLIVLHFGRLILYFQILCKKCLMPQQGSTFAFRMRGKFCFLLFPTQALTEAFGALTVWDWKVMGCHG